jgi:AcrR family transcriptional regulator
VNTVSPRTYSKLARAEAEERTRAALIAAADEAFLSGPWERASLESIAHSAGVTKQTLLRHFGSKDGLLEQTLRLAMGAVGKQRLSAPTDDIPAAVDNLLDHYEERGGRAMRSTNLDVGGPLAELAQIARQFHYDWIDHAFGHWLGPAPAPERARLRGALIAICDVQSWWILAHDLGLSRPEVRETLILCIRRLLGDT